MADFLHHLFFGIYPYIALAVLAVGSVIRYDREPYSWRAGSSQLLRRKQLMWGSVLFHVGVLFIFFGHLVGLLTPIALFDALGISHGAKQLLAIIAGGIAGMAKVAERAGLCKPLAWVLTGLCASRMSTSAMRHARLTAGGCCKDEPSRSEEAVNCRGG